MTIQDAPSGVVATDDSFTSNLEICYEVLLYLSSRLAKLPAGGRLEFVTGDTTAPEKIPAWIETRSYTLLDSGVTADGRHRFVIQK